MSALTKSEMADKLFEELGLNKREAKELVEQFFEEIPSALRTTNKSNCQALEILILETSVSGREETRKPAKPYPYRPAEWSHFDQVKS